MVTRILALFLFLGITVGYFDVDNFESRHKRQATTDANLNILLGLSFPLKDANYYLNAYKNGSTNAAVLAVAEAYNWPSIKKLDPKDVANWMPKAYDKAKLDLKDILKIAKQLKELGIVVNKTDAAYRHQTGFQITSNISRDLTPAGLVIESATAMFKEKLGLSNKAVTGLALLSPIAACEKDTTAMLQAPFQSNVICNATQKYRSIDGSCNNLVNVLQGASFKRFRRTLFPEYSDGVSAPRKNSLGFNLPSARVVSTTINRLPNVESTDLSIFHMTYGQFIDHDLTFTPIIKFPNVTALQPYANLPISCCDLRFTGVAGLFAQKLGCYPIDIPVNDSLYACVFQTCMEFKRSAPAPTCTMGPREQMNEITAYLDGSMIYGSRKLPVGSTDPLRTMTNGLLKVQAGDLLPVNTAADNGCNTPENSALGEYCFIAGDFRVNEQQWLVFFHTVWAREHNRVAKIIKDAHPAYNDETIYQETRRIVVGELQHVTFNEFLTTILPKTLMTSAGLTVGNGTSQTNIYNVNVDATMPNSFAAAVYRFGHSEIADFHQRINKYGTVDTLEFSSTQINPFYLYTSEAMPNLARGTLNLRARKVDASFTKEVAGKLFRGNKPLGLDLVALNIQRGRDHGIPGYVKFLNFCGISVTSFSGLTAVMTQDNINALQSVYSNVNDIDLFAGGMSESPVPGGFLGYTFTCLVADQFKRLKYGDRFWYEEVGQAGSFTPAQVGQLHQASLARIVCDTVPDLKYIQRYPLRNPGPDNPVVACIGTDIPKVDLSLWN